MAPLTSMDDLLDIEDLVVEGDEAPAGGGLLPGAGATAAGGGGGVGAVTNHQHQHGRNRRPASIPFKRGFRLCSRRG